jgi:diguanylate cyclase (GGDEF)-like protein
VTRPSRRWLFVVGSPLALLSLFAAQAGATAMAVTNTCTVTALALLLMSGDRRHDALRRTRLLLLCALAASFVAGLMPLIYLLQVGHAPPRPWLSDGVALTYVPFTVAGLLLIPAASARVGHRARALADGMVAAGSLWYLLAALAVGTSYGSGGLSAAVALAFPIGDVFVVSSALTVLARCCSPARPMVAWIVAGLTAVAAQDVWVSASGQAGTARGPALLYQAGLLLLLGAAAAPAITDPGQTEESAHSSWALGALPFVPLLASMAWTTRMVLGGADMPHRQVLPALAVAVALTLRQFTASRDKQRLVVRLLQRESGLEVALRRDHLTGLANRLALMERLDDVLSDPEHWPVAIALLDLNDFKLINDNHGHAVGDEVLQELASRLSGAVRDTDLVARLGGDEFAVVITGVGTAQRNLLADRLMKAFDAPVQVAQRLFPVTVSIGVVLAQPTETPGELLAHADAAMYQAKADKRGTSRVITVTGEDREHVSSQSRMREAIAAPDLDQFHVLYQPVVDLATGRIRGIEALLRWHHPELGNIPPDTFIPLAEQAGSIGALGRFVLETGTADLAALQQLRPDHRLAIGINVSPRQLATSEFVEHVHGLLERHGLAADQLVLEITEQAFVADLDPVADTVARLADAGVSVAVDDFGTGYSSLRYLQHLRLDIMKIDRSFVAEINNSHASRELVSAVAAMGRTLDLQLVAEGIETLDQLRFLQEINCELGQGYLFSQPVVIGDIARLLSEGHSYPVGETAATPIVPDPRSDRTSVFRI